MSSLNRPNSNLLSSVNEIENDPIELSVQISSKIDHQKDVPQCRESLIEQSNYEIESTNQKNIKNVNNRRLNKSFEFDLIQLIRLKNFSFLIILLISILLTFYLSKCKIEDHISLIKCINDSEFQIEDIIKNVTKVYRLPTNIIPINYHIQIQPYMNSNDLFFNGSVSILINCQNVTNIIQMNANELEIDNQQVSISITNSTIQNHNPKIINLTIENEVLILELDRNLRENENYSIFISFKGNLTTSLSGFYRSSYLEPSTNESRYFLLTQFQATDARRAFPCWDEPSFKATFDIEITHWRNMTAIANMPNNSYTEIDSIWMRTKFERTVKMSTYLVAYAVGDFRFKETTQDGINYRIVTRPSEIESAKAAIQFSPKILKHFEQYFQIKFPLSKIDMLSAPDFSAGGMENFGLIIYREAYLLYDKRVGSVVQLYRICSVIAHELAHQWFGNLITPIHWNDLWLNEVNDRSICFATYMSYVAVNSVKPEWQIMERFVLDEIHDVLGLDALKNSHPISVEVNDPNEISELFDHISYSKSASIIRMMTYIIGEETFREGLHNFLNAFKYSNADQSDLWRYLQEATDKNDNTNQKVNIQKVMNSWTLTSGYPLIRIIRDYKTNQINFTQQRFLLNSNESDRELLFNTQYEVPITYTTKKEQDWNPKIKIWLHQTNELQSYFVKQFHLSKDDWIIANLQQIGYYRVTYDDQNWELLVNQLRNDDHNKIHPINRAQILNDLFNLAETGEVSYSLALKALEYLKKEDHYLPLNSISQNIYLINKMLRRQDSFGKWQAYIRSIIKPAYDKFKLKDLNNENLKENQMQRSIVNLACAYELNDCRDESQRLFKQLMDNFTNNVASENTISPNLRSAIYCTAIHNGGEAEWDFLFKRYLNEQNFNECNVMLNALTCSKIPWILNRYLKWMFDESSGIKSQDGVSVFRGVASQNYGIDLAFNYLRENWDKIHNIHGKSMSFAHIVKSLDSLNSEFELKLVKEFFKSIGTKVGTSKRAFLQTIETIESNIVWMKKHEQSISNYLNEFSSNS